MAIGERLESPPLVEALCEFRFVPSGTWDWTIPGRLYDLISEDFPDRAQVEEVAMQLEPGDVLTHRVVKGPGRVQLKRSDGSAMVQVGPNLLVINQLKPYTGWPDFLARILDVYETYKKLASSLDIARIGLRYINQIPLSEEMTDLSLLISVDPPLTGRLQRPLLGFYQRYELSNEEPEGVLIHQSGLQKNEDSDFILIDLDFNSQTVEGVAASSDLREWLEKAHNCIEESFIDSLNPDLYENLKQREHGNNSSQETK